MQRILAVSTTAAMLAGLIAAGPSSATSRSVADLAQRNTGNAVAGVPRYADARVPTTPRIPRRVAAITALDVFRRRDVSPRERADYIQVQAIVATSKGRLARGPVQRLDLDGPDRFSTGSRVRLDKRDNVRAGLALTTKQRAVLRRQAAKGTGAAKRAAMIRVVFRHYRDGSPTSSIHEDVASVGARARNGGHKLRLPAPRAALASSSPGQVRLSNGTNNPLVAMAGPNSCMYDSLYGSTYSGDHGSQLGTMNGVILAPGQSIQAYVLDDKSDLDGREDNQDGDGVLQDYNDYLNDAYAQASSQYPQDLPELIIPDGDDESPWVDMDLSIGFFGREVTKNVVDEEGLWGTFAKAAGSEEGLTEEEIDAYAPFLETVSTGVELFLEPVVELVLELLTLFDNSCMTHDGYMMVGATDQAHPWRQFAQIYDWGSANPLVPKPGAQGFTSLANGIVGNVVTTIGSSTADSPSQSSQPNTANGVSTWTFTEADQPVDDPAIVSWAPGTRDVTCRPKDPATLIPPAGLSPRVYDMLPPYRAIRDFAGNAASPSGSVPNDWLVGLHYISGDSTGSVHYSTDGQTWSDLDIPAGQDTVTLPGNAQAVLVKCDLQVAEVFSHATTSGRKALMGTRIASDIVTGPDYKGTPQPAPSPGAAGSATSYKGPRNPTNALLPTEQGMWWQEYGHSGFLRQRDGAVQWFPRGVASVRTPDGFLWGPGSASGKTTIVRFDPTSFRRTDYPVPSHGGIMRMVLGPDSCLWYLEAAAYIGKFCPSNGWMQEFSTNLPYGEDLFAGPDGTLWVSDAGSVIKINTQGQLVAVLPAVWPGLDRWTLGPDGQAWTVASSTDSTHPMSLVKMNPAKTSCLVYWACATTYRTPQLLSAFQGVFDAQGMFWYRGVTGPTSGDGVIIRFDPQSQTSTQFAVPYHGYSPITVGTDGRIWSGGDTYDNRLMAVSTGSGPAATPPEITTLFVGATGTCNPATWTGDATVVRRYWTNAATGEVLGQGDTYAPGASMQGQVVQCHEVATLPWVQTPLTTDSGAAIVRGRYATSGASNQQSPSKPLTLPKRIKASGTTTIVSKPITTTAGQRATVTVTATHTGTSTPAKARHWSLVRQNGSVRVRVHSRRALTLLVSVKAPRKGRYAPLRIARVYRVEPGRHAPKRP